MSNSYNITEGEKEITSIRFTEETLEEIDNLVEEGEFEDRTDAILTALERNSEEEETKKDEELLYDAAVTAYHEALHNKEYEIARNARHHIMNEFPDTKFGSYLRERTE